MKYSKNYAYDPNSHICRFESFDEQIARSILENNPYFPFEFDNYLKEATYNEIQEAVQDLFNELGFTFDADPALVDSVYNIIRTKVCGDE